MIEIHNYTVFMFKSLCLDFFSSIYNGFGVFLYSFQCTRFYMMNKYQIFKLKKIGLFFSNRFKK